MLHDRYSFCSPERKEYPELPLDFLLEHWFKNASQRSAFMRSTKGATNLKIRKKIATRLGLQSANVVIVQHGDSVSLFSAERESPLARLSTTSTAPVMTQQTGSHENFLRGAPDTGDCSPEHIGLTSPHISRDPRKD